MNVIIVDDERLALMALEAVVTKLEPNATLHSFTEPSKALAYAEGTQVDVAFLDIEMGGMTGLSLAEKLRELHKKTNVIFTTGYSQYALPAFELSASGYLIKPVAEDAVARELANLRYPVAKVKKNVRIQTFGHFEVFVDDRPLCFARAKSKEILAYLVDRKGAGIMRKEMAAILWGDREYTRTVQTHLQILISELTRTLQEAGAGKVLIHYRGNYAVDASRVSCDYYDFNAGIPEAIEAYAGEYMANYSWAEFTQSVLNDRRKRLEK